MMIALLIVAGFLLGGAWSLFRRAARFAASVILLAGVLALAAAVLRTPS